VGEFLVQTQFPDGRVFRRRLPNYLMYRVHGRILRAMFPPASGGGSFSFELGFAGPMYRAPSERPNYDLDSFTLDRRGKYSDFVGMWANEGGLPSDDTRTVAGYERAAVTWAVTEDGKSVRIDSGWHEWAHGVQWQRYGDWAPQEWLDDEHGTYPQPWPWTDCSSWEGSHGFPYCQPRINSDYWLDVGPPESGCFDSEGNPVDCEHPDNSNPWGFACPSCIMSGHQWGGYPTGCAFIIITGAGYDDEAFAAAAMAAPFHWRMGGTVSMRYVGRFAAGEVCSIAFAKAMAQRFLAGTAPPWSDASWKAVLVSESAIRDGMTLDQLTQVLDQKAATAWMVQEYVAPDPEAVPPVEEVLPYVTPSSAISWTNGSGEAVEFRSIVFVATNATTGKQDVLFWEVLDEPVTIPNGDTWTLSTFKFRIAELADG